MRSKIYSLAEIIQIVQNWKSAGSEVVFTNGCFDLLHAGHIHSLVEARKHGDKLVVAINSDESVKRLKGANRPIINEQNRLFSVSALEVVDAVVLFAEDTPIKVIEALIPDVLVKGGDYEKSNIVGADIVEEHGGKVQLIELVDGFSTTEIIKRIKSK